MIYVKTFNEHPVLCLRLIIYQLFTEVMLKCLSCLVSAEHTCTFNNNKLAVTLGAITCIPAFMRKWQLLPSIPGCGLYFLPQKASEIPVGRGSKRRQFPRGWGQILKVFLSRDFETKIIVFIGDLTLTVIAECFFHS